MTREREQKMLCFTRLHLRRCLSDPELRLIRSRPDDWPVTVPGVASGELAVEAREVT